jgi:hypothetical protein
MTAWFDPGQLFVTGLRTLVSTLFGANADRRLLDALAHHEPNPCDLSGHDELWIDYVSDTGDGWNSTYAVAHHVAQPVLAVADPLGASHDTRRAQLLVFGGDEVYPTPSRAAYEQKLVAPYRTALPDADDPRPGVFAVPGNHDWYDSLVSFTRLFCSTRVRSIGGWEARQTLSYFAVKLPHHWWLIGTDVQLDSDIDDPQLEYFRKVAQEMEDGDRIILCTAEPDWVYEARYAAFDPTVTERNLDYLKENVFGGRIEVYLAGDLHHYRRHAAPDGRQKITAGGGGAFLSPTHHDVDEVATLKDGFVCRASFPSPKESKRLSWGNLIFPWYNWMFGLVTGVLYLLLAWSVKADLWNYGLSETPRAMGVMLTAVLGSQTAVMWGVVVLGGFIFFTDTRSKKQKWIGGSVHAVAHIFAAALIGWGAVYLAFNAFPGAPYAAKLLITGLAAFVGGYVVGAAIMGLYLLISLNAFGRHNTEAFSSMHIEDFKSWVRFHVASDGALRIYPIGLRRVARKWRAARPEDGTPSLLVPDDRRATAPELIEPPVVIPAAPVRAGASPLAASARTTTVS